MDVVVYSFQKCLFFFLFAVTTDKMQISSEVIRARGDGGTPTYCGVCCSHIVQDFSPHVIRIYEILPKLGHISLISLSHSYLIQCLYLLLSLFLCSLSVFCRVSGLVSLKSCLTFIRPALCPLTRAQWKRLLVSSLSFISLHLCPCPCL